MGWFRRLFPTSEPLEDQISAYVADRLDAIDPGELPTVIAGRMLIADTAATLPMVAHNGRERIVPTPSILRRPDPREPYRTTIEKICNSLTGWGMVWLRVYTWSDSTGYPLAIRVIHPDRVTYRLTIPGDDIAEVWIDGTKQDMRDIRWIPFRSDLGPIGTSPLDDIAGSLEQLAEIYRFGADYYTTAAIPPYALKHPNRLTRDKAEEFAVEWAAARAARRPAVLSGGIELETYAPPSAGDALLLQAIDSLDATIARTLLIPPSLLNVVSQSSLTYTTTEQEFRRWLQLGLMPGYLARIEAAFSDMLPRGTDAIFDVSAMTRMDQSARIATLAQSIGAGIHTTAEARALEGLPADTTSTPVPISPNVEGL